MLADIFILFGRNLFLLLLNLNYSYQNDISCILI
jgi:hypothetical protein